MKKPAPFLLLALLLACESEFELQEEPEIEMSPSPAADPILTDTMGMDTTAATDTILMPDSIPEDTARRR